MAKINATRHVVFDVVGSLVSYDRLFEAIGARFEDHLKTAGISPKLLGCCWLETADKEYTYISLGGRYLSFADCVEPLFYRVLHYAGITEPRKFASPEDVKYLISEWQKLEMRPGAAECVQKLRDAGFTVWCLTTGDIKRVGGYFKQAGIEMPADNLLSCDQLGVAKPRLEAYKPLLERLKDGHDMPWFATAHAWDACNARVAG